jgi:gluconate kinase
MRELEQCSAVLACSALKREYRDLLMQDLDNVIFVYLSGTPGLIRLLQFSCTGR